VLFHSQVCVLSEQSLEAALSCLHNCPLLEDMVAWSQWSLVFEPQHGQLDEFINKYGGKQTHRLSGIFACRSTK